MAQLFPAAYYGKRSEEKDRDRYGLLGHSGDFPSEALGQLEILAASLQWSGGGGNDPYSDCFAVWPVSGDGAIVARLRDFGKDKLQRPHTMRIEAAWIERQKVTDWALAIRKLLHNQAWADVSTGEYNSPVSLSLEHTNSDLGITVSKALADETAIPSILVATHRNYRASGFEIIQDPSKPSGVSQLPQKRETPSVSPSAAPGQQHVPKNAQQFKWPLFLILALCGPLICVAAWGYYSLHNLQKRHNKSVAEHDDEVSQLKRDVKNHQLGETTAKEGLKAAADEQKKTRAALEKAEQYQKEYESVLREFKLQDSGELRIRLKAYDRDKANTPALEAREQQMRLEKHIESLIRDLNQAIRKLEQIGQPSPDESRTNRD